ncbi:flagellar basal body-associated FliL family protein [Saccharibacillus sp. CPCC 101409]|uniref:flagellar basal body-associated FliL family protein n=1 Tax=Saccharibacillus sp. CPCC 101409 TaxID=3058041 RepID=UPI0026724288|nr:flagellar basal body-associated FliL family protein [Saccharibacillus sp. CPCC 101409]MDO3410693.1 flagellar basal body-associated FliL family protein [Saccharibacillus sp. CPCC 101409]
MKKLLPWIITMFLAITLIVVAVFLVLGGGHSKDANAAAGKEETKQEVKKLTAKQIVAQSSDMTGIKTNLSDPSYIVQIDFSFQLDSAKTKAEFDEIKDITIKPIVLMTLASTTPESVSTAKGKTQLNTKLKNLINKALPEGEVVDVSITNFLLASI